MKIIEGRFTGFYQSDFGNFLQMQIGRQNPSIGYNLWEVEKSTQKFDKNKHFLKIFGGKLMVCDISPC